MVPELPPDTDEKVATMTFHAELATRVVASRSKTAHALRAADTKAAAEMPAQTNTDADAGPRDSR